MIERFNSPTDPKETRKVQETAGAVFDLYQSYYGHSKDKQVYSLEPVEENRQFMNDGIDMVIPRGQYVINPYLYPDSSGKKLGGVKFSGDAILFVRGNPSLVDSENPQEVYKAILAHELIHSQIVPQGILGVDPVPLSARELRYGGDIHYALGFKAVSVNLQTGKPKYITRNLEEFITQYLAMSMLNAFDVENSTFEKMKVHGLGINADYFFGAEAFNKIFNKYGISPQTIEAFHHESDIRGFMNLLKGISVDLHKKVLSASTDPDPYSSIRKLEDALHIDGK